MDSGAKRHFAAGAGGRRYCDDGCARVRNFFRVVVILGDWSGVARAHCHGLGGIDDRPAANGDHAVASFLPVNLGSFFNAVDSRVFWYPIKNWESGVLWQCVHDLPQNAAFNKIPVAHD
jgi:hypothetical protein